MLKLYALKVKPNFLYFYLLNYYYNLIQVSLTHLQILYQVFQQETPNASKEIIKINIGSIWSKELTDHLLGYLFFVLIASDFWSHFYQYSI